MTDAVKLAYLHPHTVSQSFSESLLQLVSYDAGHSGRVITAGGPWMLRCASGGLVSARNTVAAKFLDETDHPWLFLVDSDMGFTPDAVDRLVDAADPVERPAVGGLCFGIRHMAADGMGGFTVRPFPTLYDWMQTEDGTFGFHLRRDYEPDVLTQVAGTGAAFLLVHRGLLEKIRAESGDAWFDRARMTDGTLVSEDLSFCYRVAKAGSPLFVHTGVRTTHHKEFWLGEDEYWIFENAYRAALGE